VDASLPRGGALSLLEKLGGSEQAETIPIAVYAEGLTADDEERLARLGETVPVSTARSEQELLERADEMAGVVASALAADRSRARREAADVIFHGKRALVVDDDIRNVFALTSVLEAHGLEVLYAENGSSAIETLRQSPDVDIVLMDVMMPEMDGYETMRAVRELPEFAALPIVAVTAKAMKEDRDRCIAAGASEYVRKPVDPDELLAVIGIWLYPTPASMRPTASSRA
jgi:CheY-like chemotaxis protein